MNLTESEKTLFDSVNKAISSYFGVDSSDLYCKKGHSNIAEYKMFFYYFLKYELDVSSSKIALYADKTTRNVKYGVSKMKYLVGMYEEYQLITDSIKKELGLEE